MHKTGFHSHFPVRFRFGLFKFPLFVEYALLLGHDLNGVQKEAERMTDDGM
jgi:hypothetical protein